MAATHTAVRVCGSMAAFLAGLYLSFCILTASLGAAPTPNAADRSAGESDNGAPLRTWTDSTGKRQTKAAMVRVEGDKGHFRLADGREVVMPLEKLCQADREWIAKQAERPAAEPRWTEAEVINEIADLGGTVVTDESSPDRPVVEVSLFHTHVTDAQLEHLAVFSRLRTLNLSCCEKVTDEGLAHLKALPQLESLCLNFTRITGPGLANLNGLPRLRRLMLERCHKLDDGHGAARAGGKGGQ